MSKEPKKVSFYLRLHNGNGCNLHLPSSYTLQRALSILVDQKLSLPTTYRLIINGKHVRDYSLTIAELGITEGSIVHVQEASQRLKSLSKIDVTVFFEGEKIVLQAKYCDLIVNLKQQIFQMYYITPQEQILVFKGHKLKNDRTLQHYRIQPDSLICLQIASPNDPQISAKLVNREDQLLESVLSLTRKKSSSSQTTLFRSDSIGERKYKDLGSFDVEIKQKRQNETCLKNVRLDGAEKTQALELKNSITFNIFENELNPYARAEVYSESVDSEMELNPIKALGRQEEQLRFKQI